MIGLNPGPRARSLNKYVYIYIYLYLPYIYCMLILQPVHTIIFPSGKSGQMMIIIITRGYVPEYRWTIFQSLPWSAAAGELIWIFTSTCNFFWICYCWPGVLTLLLSAASALTSMSAYLETQRATRACRANKSTRPLDGWLHARSCSWCSTPIFALPGLVPSCLAASAVLHAGLQEKPSLRIAVMNVCMSLAHYVASKRLLLAIT